MQEIQSIELIPIKGTSDQQMLHQQRPQSSLTSRSRTIQTFLKKQTLDNIVISFNKHLSKLNQNPLAKSKWQRQRPIKKKLSRYLKQHIRPSIRPFMRSHQLWGDSYYTSVLKGSNITDRYFLENHDEIKENRKVEVTTVEKDRKVFEEEVMGPVKAMGEDELRRYRRRGRRDLKSILEEVQREKENTQRAKIERNNCYKDMSNMFLKKMTEFRVSCTDEMDTDDFEMMKRCLSYNHLVEKNLPKSYRLNNTTANSMTPNSPMCTPRQRSNPKIPEQPHTKTKPASKALKIVRRSFQSLQDSILNFQQTTKNQQLKQQMQAFVKYYQKCQKVRATKQKNLRKLR